MAVNVDKLRKRSGQHGGDRERALKLIRGGRDVQVNLGGRLTDWRGSRVSDMIDDHDGAKILRFIIRKMDDKFPDEVAVIKRMVLERFGD